MKKLLTLVILSGCFFGCQGPYRLVYITDRDSNFNIYLTDQYGETHTALTTNPGWDWYPKWNKKLRGIIYNSSDTLKNFSIRLMSIEGRSMPLNTHGLEEFILSPNGKHALFTQKEGTQQYIYSYDLISQSERLIVNFPAYNGRPQWSPDGKMISFISDRSGNNDIYLYEWATGNITRLTNSPAREKYTSWSPRSTSILFTAQEPGNDYNDIYVIEIETKYQYRITDNQNNYEEICWSPDGTKIAFHAEQNGKHHIFTMNSDGTEVRRITQVNAYHGEPEWIPGK